MSKELLNVENMKLKFIVIVIILIIIVVAGIIFASFYISNKNDEKSQVEQSKTTNIYKPKSNKNELAISEDKNENAIFENKIENAISEDKVENKISKDNNEIIQDEKDESTDKSNDISNKNETNKVIANEETSKTEARLPEWTDTAIQDIKDIYGSSEKQVYLTFDDGPSPDITPQIIQILKEEGVPATFFVLGRCVNSYPDLVKQEYNEGHFIANHGYTHTYSQIYASIDNVVNEYNQTNDAIKKAIGNDNYDCHLFRFPGGSSGGPYDSLKAQAKQYLADNQVASTNWNCLTSDAAGNTTVEAQYQGALDTQGNKNSLIILMHDAAGKNATPETLRRLIHHYKEQGFVFKNFYDIFKNEPINEVENINIEQ